MSEKFDLESELRELAESKELLNAVSDIDYSKHVVDGISEETGIAKWKVKLAYKALSPLIRCMAEGTGKLLADGMKQKMLSIAARIPWTEKVVKAIKGMTTKTTQEIQSTKHAKEYLNQLRSTDQAALEFRKELSLEFNVALDNYTATQEMRAEFGDSLDGIREDLSRIEGFVNPQPKFKQPIKRSQRHRFVYRSDFIPFVGRTAELEKLHNFLWSDDLFGWQAITAPGGVGKSRLAWEFCQRSSVVWRAGFVDNLQTEKASLASWQPKQPTLLVIDYASKDREEVKGILKTLAERADLDCAVRVLLLDRDSSDEWLTEGWPGSDGHAVEDCRYQEPWALETTLGEDASKEILRFFLGNEQSVSDTELQGHLKTLEGIDPKKRPIFAAFYADAVVREGAGRRWDRNSLIQDVIEREKNQYWQRDDIRLITKSDEALLALATITGGIRSIHTNLPPCVTSISELLEYPERFEALGCDTEYDEFGTLTPLIPGWEPDLVGELFVLDMLKDLGRTGTNVLRKPLLETAWALSPFSAFSFLNRSVQDYPEEKIHKQLLLPPKDKRLHSLWLMLAMNTIHFCKTLGNHELITYLYDTAYSMKQIHNNEHIHSLIAECGMNLIGALSEQFHNKCHSVYKHIYTNYLKIKNEKNAVTTSKSATNFIAVHGQKHTKECIDKYTDTIEISKTFPNNMELKTLHAQAAKNFIFSAGSSDISTCLRCIDDIKKLSDHHPDDIQIATELCQALVNMLNAQTPPHDIEYCKAIFKTLNTNYLRHKDSTAIALQLANGCGNMIHILQNNNCDEIKNLHKECEHIHDTFPQCADIANAYAYTTRNYLASQHCADQTQSRLAINKVIMSHSRASRNDDLSLSTILAISNYIGSETLASTNTRSAYRHAVEIVSHHANNKDIVHAFIRCTANNITLQKEDMESDIPDTYYALSLADMFLSHDDIIQEKCTLSFNAITLSLIKPCIVDAIKLYTTSLKPLLTSANPTHLRVISRAAANILTQTHLHNEVACSTDLARDILTISSKHKHDIEIQEVATRLSNIIPKYISPNTLAH